MPGSLKFSRSLHINTILEPKLAGSAHVPYGPGLTEIGPTDTTDEVVLEFWTKSARGVASHFLNSPFI